MCRRAGAPSGADRMRKTKAVPRNDAMRACMTLGCVAQSRLNAAARRRTSTRRVVQALIQSPRGKGMPCERPDRNDLYAISSPREARALARSGAHQALARGAHLL